MDNIINTSRKKTKNFRRRTGDERTLDHGSNDDFTSQDVVVVDGSRGWMSSV